MSKSIEISDIKVAQPEKVEEVVDFFNQRTIKQELSWFTHTDTIDRAVNRNDRNIYYFESDDEIVAALMVWCESSVLESDQAQIRLVATDPDFRGIGLGRRLVTKAESFAHEKDKMIADVKESSSAMDFWKSCGYESFDSYETKTGKKMISMRKILGDK